MFEIKWPFVTRKRMLRESAEWAAKGHEIGYRLGHMDGVADYERDHLEELKRSQQLLKELIRFTVSQDVQSNSDTVTVTLFFNKVLKQIHGEDGYANFVAGRVRDAFYQMIVRSTKG